MRFSKFSAALAAVALLFTFDMWLRQFYPMSTWPTPNLERSEASNAIKQFDLGMERSGQERGHVPVVQPGLLLLGSSLVVAPILQQESIFLNKPFDERTQVRLKFFDAIDFSGISLLSSCHSVYRLALHGEMVSDAYLILKHLLMNDVKPSAIVYGIAPRDFHSNLLGPYVRSETFQSISSPSDLPDVARLRACSFQELIDVAIGRFSKFWLSRTDIRKYVCLRMKKLIDRCSPVPLFERYNPITGTRVQKEGQFPEDVPGHPTVFPNVPLAHNSRKDSVGAYWREYNPVHPALLDIQFSFFSKVLRLCRENQIKLVVVNMPLSKTNRNLMPAGFYDDYIRRVQKCCAENNTQFLNVQTKEWDDDANYVDTVHISPASSRRFIDDLLKAIRGGSTVAFEAKSNYMAER